MVALAGPDTDFPTHDQVDHAHGRTERRLMCTAPGPRPELAHVRAQVGWRC